MHHTLNEPHCLEWDDRLLLADKELVAKLNATLGRLNVLRAVEITVSGPFARSKIAWKLATYQHVLLHRIVALIDGVAVACNNRCALAAILSARALMETVAAVAALEANVLSQLANKDLSQIDAIAQRGISASRDTEWLRTNPELIATNVVTYIDKLNKIAPGVRSHYDALSELCHPNSRGHNFLFSTLDRSDGTVRFCDERDPQGNAHMIFAALALFPLVESMMPRLDAMILEVSDLQHGSYPVGDPPPSGTLQLNRPSSQTLG